MVETNADMTSKKPESEIVQDSTTKTPHPHDVLCGRGGQSNNHPGNEWFRRLVRSNRVLYRSCPKHTKLLVAKAIVQAVQQQDPPGRFVKLIGNSDTKESVWEPITYTQAVNKTSQALREKESRDSRNKRKQQEKNQQINQKKSFEIGNEDAKPVQKEAKGSDRPNPLEHREINILNQEPKNVGPLAIRDQRHNPVQAIPPPLGQKRKISDSSAKPQWRMGSTEKAMDTTLGMTLTPDSDVAFNNGHGNKRMKVSEGGEGNADTDRMGHEMSKMGRGVVKQVKNLASLTETQVETEIPFPAETTLGVRQSTLFRFLNSTGIFGREAAVAQVQPTVLRNPHGAGVSQNVSQATLWPQQTVPTTMGQRMGLTSVQHLRSGHFPSKSSENEKNMANSVARLEEEMEDIPTSGLMMRGDGGVHDAAPPPPQKGLKSQMSDWLSSFFPPTNRDEPRDSVNNTNNTNFDSPSHDGVDNEGTAMPPPPGGEMDLGRGVSSAIFGLAESPSLFLSTLKSGVSSVFGDTLTGETFLPTMRRFPSTFQQQQMRQQQQQEQNFPQQQSGGAISGGGAMIGNHPVLGERAGKRDSLLDDIDETPMEKELRNAKPEEKTRGVQAIFGSKPSNFMSFK